MASLKEIKSRISSVKSTQKITSAMKMVSSAKLRKAQYQIEHFLPYQEKLNVILSSFLASVSGFDTKLAEEREVKNVAIVVVSSNSSLCGAFNSNIIKLLNDTIDKYEKQNCTNIEVYAIGKKVENQAARFTFPVEIKGGYIDLIDKPNFDGAKGLAENLIQKFLDSKIDRVELLYNHYKSNTFQISTKEQFLPINLDDSPLQDTLHNDYIVEPDQNTVLHSLIPKSLHSKIYAILLDSAAAEQAARVVAMQIATDNAEDLLGELTIQYNKQRQQAITNELLDILGGSEALK